MSVNIQMDVSKGYKPTEQPEGELPYFFMTFLKLNKPLYQELLEILKRPENKCSNERDVQYTRT
jgi:hypothetical protein